MSCYLVAGCKSWNRRIFEEKVSKSPGIWHYLDHRDALTIKRVRDLSPQRIFFFHWSWIVTKEIVENYECVCFHMTDVPYGRGGSPLQNLIIRGHRNTKLTALQMTEVFDAGPVYLKANFSLEGGAEEIYIRMTELAADMVLKINKDNLQPVPQTGQPTFFKRRTPKQSCLEGCADLSKVFDFIRMLDAEGYPKAFLEHEGFRYEFSRPTFYEGRIRADVEITPLEDGEVS